jgi:hypothetical protein
MPATESTQRKLNAKEVIFATPLFFHHCMTLNGASPLYLLRRGIEYSVQNWTKHQNSQKQRLSSSNPEIEKVLWWDYDNALQYQLVWMLLIRNITHATKWKRKEKCYPVIRSCDGEAWTAMRFLLQWPAAAVSLFPSVYTKAYISSTQEQATGLVRKVVVVGLWCLQISPSDWPSMSRVVDMLEKSTDELQLPPHGPWTRRGFLYQCIIAN